MNINIKLPMVRASFCKLFKAEKFDENAKEGSEKFSCVFILDKKKHAKQIKEIQTGIQAVLDEKFGKGKMTPKKLVGQLLRDGADKPDLDGYGPGVVFLSASNKNRPVVVDADKSVLTAEEGRPYSGCYVNASIGLWGQDNQFGKRVNATLRAVQFCKHGTPFGEKPADADEEFDDVSAGVGEQTTSAEEADDLLS